jgi:hypothetical protein
MPKLQMSAWERSAEFLRKVLVNNNERERQQMEKEDINQ